jgi:hypothetical protein
MTRTHLPGLECITGQGWHKHELKSAGAQAGRPAGRPPAETSLTPYNHLMDADRMMFTLTMAAIR